ncbi:MAG: hypothetical protein OSJ56_01940 [Prevotella sp.]|uniref:hypothetical protein n=1 Tax=Prevotella sp. PTAC TaxID=2736295 RepID=UPI001556FBBB|nr:hypothetical protein [Prevotella sp. PTAC]MCX4292802.1 hypothetical protein [Prevotella sp.]NPD54921.1 hypothetical protein [Prevotella sp. PTAC]
MSCSNDEEFCNEYVGTDEPKVNQSTLISTLQDLNAQILESDETRGFRDWSTKEKLAVAHADVAGMAAGGKDGCVLGAKLGTVLDSPITGGVFGAFLGRSNWGCIFFLVGISEYTSNPKS